MQTVVRRPEAGQGVYVGLDIARTKWVFNVRWGGQEQRRVSTPAGLEHLRASAGWLRLRCGETIPSRPPPQHRSKEGADSVAPEDDGARGHACAGCD